MSEPSLSDREMAILAGLAARAEAADPRLAHMLRGHRRKLNLRFPAPPAVLRHWAVGLAVALCGLALTLATLAVSLPAAIVGGVIIFAGAGRLAVAASGARSPSGAAESDPDAGAASAN